MSITLPFGISASAIWIAIGFLGQAMFFMRFFVQWIASEKEGKSIIPQSFWYFSIAGSLILLAYAIWRAQDPVIILGQSTDDQGAHRLHGAADADDKTGRNRRPRGNVN